MGSAGIELPRPVNRQTVEKAHAMAVRGPQDHEYSFMQAGMRAARARDPKLLLALEKGAEVLDAVSDEQMGQTRRESSATRSQKAQHTEASLWREAVMLWLSWNRTQERLSAKMLRVESSPEKLAALREEMESLRSQAIDLSEKLMKAV